MLEPYVRPGIDDRPDYDKALSKEDKSAVARLAADPKRLPPEASADQPGVQTARLAADGTASVAAAAAVDTAVPDYASSFLDMRDPMVAADGERPDAAQVTRLKWAFAAGSMLIAAPWAALNLVAIPNQVALAFGIDTKAALAGIVSGASSVSGASGPAAVSAASVSAIHLAPALASIVCLGAIASVFFTPLVAALSDRTRVRFGRRTPYLVVGGVLSALLTLALGALQNVAGLIVFWVALQFSYAMLVAPLASALSERVPDKFRDVIERWNAIGVIAGQAAGGVIGGLAIAFGAFNPFLCAAVLFAVAGFATVLVWPREPSSEEQPHTPFSWTMALAAVRMPSGPESKPFRRLVWSRMFMMAAVGMTGAYLWYIVRFAVYGDDPKLTSAPMTLPAGMLVALMALATFAGALLATFSAGAITDKLEEGFGAWWRDSRVAVMMACVLYVLGLLAGLAIVAVGGERSLMVFSFITGFAFGLIDVLVQPLVVAALPDPRAAGRDLGVYAAAKPWGLAFGVVVGAVVVMLVPASLGYVALFPAAAVCVAVAAFLARK
ncbi:MFS transporter [Bifidobacterium saguinibicoloris]|uniref:MFS transporter n=1 Tax=Bifidobacterium saguinibicoloris TaxID=2834433 RepID=UPI001C560C44|nr:MFS transporter [Bifidobacterium saguinibicoloris]MBW3080965.1 MFS transporter [Bifidobacterium saguinibicoloris]